MDDTLDFDEHSNQVQQISKQFEELKRTSELLGIKTFSEKLLLTLGTEQKKQLALLRKSDITNFENVQITNKQVSRPKIGIQV